MKTIKDITLIVILFIIFLFVSDINTQTKNKNSSQSVLETVNQEPQENAQEKFEVGIVLAHSLWIEDKRYLHDYTDGFKSGDKEFLLQLVHEGKAYFVEKNTGVVFNGIYEKGKIVKIRFFEGRYKNRSGYIWADFVQKVDIDK